MVETLLSLLDIARKKNKYDQGSDWSNGSSTYLDEIRKELKEVEDEIETDRLCYLEDELGDVLWDYLNILTALESEKGISPENVFRRSQIKFEERVNHISNGGSWQEIKDKQKLQLAEEYKCESKK